MSTHEKSHNESDLVEELFVVDHPEPNKCKSFGNLEGRLVSFFRPSGLRESDGVVAPTGFRWNSEARVDGGKFVSDISLCRRGQLGALGRRAQCGLTKSVDPPIAPSAEAPIIPYLPCKVDTSSSAR